MTTREQFELELAEARGRAASGSSPSDAAEAPGDNDPLLATRPETGAGDDTRPAPATDKEALLATRPDATAGVPASPVTETARGSATETFLAMDDLGLPCVHCGLCLDTCPTYRVLGTEADSPRGRIYIMESVRRGEIPLQGEAAEHLSRCLGCLACETACPSGVSFGRRIEEFRPLLIEQRSGTEKLRKDALQKVYADPRMLSLGLRAAHVADRIGLSSVRRRIPGFGLLPAASQSDPADASLSPLRRSRLSQPLRARARAAVLTGCVGDQIAPDINRDTVEVLQRNGVEIVEAGGQVCCGALALHSGRTDEAVALARTNVEAFARAQDVDFVVTTAAGCGAMMHEYAHLLRATEAATGAAALAARCRDVTEVLVDLGLQMPSRPLALGVVAYHDACHLLHARGVAKAPRLVVEAAIGKPPVDLGENAICCGSAGSYNLDQPELADALGRQKAHLARQRSADVVAVGNIGCMMQIGRHLALAGIPARVAHPIQLLAQAYRASEQPPSPTRRP
ncbi:MAG TPA: (Fe-S)-binding protein [Candidatus Binatia bacterium]|nr:(Fe-S)-binding protein [Candidatus Binatia bacterium]